MDYCPGTRLAKPLRFAAPAGARAARWRRWLATCSPDGVGAVVDMDVDLVTPLPADARPDEDLLHPGKAMSPDVGREHPAAGDLLVLVLQFEPLLAHPVGREGLDEMLRERQVHLVHVVQAGRDDGGVPVPLHGRPVRP